MMMLFFVFFLLCFFFFFSLQVKAQRDEEISEMEEEMKKVTR